MTRKIGRLCATLGLALICAHASAQPALESAQEQAAFGQLRELQDRDFDVSRDLPLDLKELEFQPGSFGQVGPDGRIIWAPARPGALADLVAREGPRLGSGPQNEMPGSPDAGVKITAAAIKELATFCGSSVIGRCANLGLMRKVETDLEAAIVAFPACSGAAAAYATYYPNRKAPTDVSSAYDLACLGSSEPRTGGVSQAAPTALTAAAPGAVPAIRSLAILEANGKAFCGALLRNDRTVVTARHCLLEAPWRAAWKAGRVTVRPVDGRAGPWPLATTFQAQGKDGEATQDDWAVLAIETTDKIGAADLAFKAPTPGAATLIAHFSDHGAVGYRPGASSDDWKRGLRWPKPGLCQVIDPLTGCARMLCQTVQGFSGSPILEDRGGPSPPAVIGFVSRPAAAGDATCGAPTSYITLAVSAAVVGL